MSTFATSRSSALKNHSARRLICITVLFNFLFLIALPGCSLLGSDQRKNVYKRAKTASRLDIPPDLTQTTPEERYTIPGASSINKQGSSTNSTSHPGVLTQPENIRVVREYGLRWLEVDNIPPEQLWHQLKQFWQNNGLDPVVENATIGLMETGWAEKHPKIDGGGLRNMLSRALGSVYSTGLRDKYISRLEPGKTANSSEVHISHRGMEEVYTSSDQEQTRWQPRASDPGLEALMLRRFMVSLGKSEDAAEESLASTQESSTKQSNAELVQGPETLLVKLPEPFDRAWRRVGQALDRDGFVVEDKNRAEGYYLVRYTKQKKPKGLLSSLAFWRASPEVEQTARRIQLTPNKTQASITELQVHTADGQADPSDTANQIASLLHQKLK